MHLKEAVFCLLLAAIMPALGIQDIVVQINTMRWSQVVSDRFLSMSIDPLAIILAGKLGPAAIHMAKGLSPIFVRIGGPNTENVRFGNSPSSRNNISVTEEEWVAVNRFAQEARLDIVLCLRAMRRTQTVWDSANALEIISTSHKHGFTDIWQMGWDMSEMTGIGGAELGRDIVRLKKILDAFPGYEHTPILAPGLSCCMNHFQTRFIKDLLQESSTAVSALPVHLNFSGVSLDKVAETIGTTLGQMEEQIWSKDLLLRTTIPRKPIWISELEPNSGEFKDAIKWIVKLGSAARFGVQVMMRQPHLLSFHSPTHDYWASLLYKNLVGRFVFDSRLLSGNRSSTFIYSHCTHPTNDELTILSSKWNYEKGALTVFGVNPSSESIKVAVRGLIMKEEPVHLYVLTEENSDSSKDNSKWHPTNTLFNGQKLILSPKGELPLLTPKERRVSRGQSIPIPPQSIFFMVLPDVKLRLCMSNPFTTDEFQDLGKKLTSPLLLPEDVIDSWEDNNADRVYVSFSKRVPAPHKPHTPQEDLKSKLLKDWHKVAGKLGIEKEFHETDLENVKYNFYNDQSWLSRLAEGLKKDPEETNSEQKKSENDSDLSRLEKYDLLTSAIYGKENNGTNLFQLSGNNYESVDPYSYHYRYVRDAELSDKKNKNNEVKLLNNENSDKLHTEPNKDMNKEILDDLLVTENHKDIHDYVVNYMKQGGHKIDSNIVNPPEGVHPLHTFMKDLEHVDVTVGQSVDHKHDKSFFDSEETQKSITLEHTYDKNTENGHQIVKRSPSNSGYENSQNYNYDQETDAFLSNQNERKNIAKLKNDDQEVETDFDNVSSFVNKNNEFSALSTEKKNDIRQIINENMEKHAAFEIAPEPELVGMEDMSISSSPSTSLVEKTMSDQTSDEYQENTEITPDFQNGNLENIDRVNLEEVSEDRASRSNIEENGLKEGINAPENPDNTQSMNSGNNNGEKSDFVNEEKKSEVKENEKPIEVEKNDPVYPEETLKEPPKFRSFSEIIEQLKTKGVKEFGQTSSYRSAKIEERIQKLESIKSRVSEIKEKIKEELNKAHEKLAQSLESIKSNGEYEQPTKRNIYDVPDKLAGLLEKLNFNYMSNVKPNSRYSRSPLLSDDEIDEILERELAETANEFYREQMLGLDDEDLINKRDRSNMHYLVPAVPGTHNVLFDREVFPAKIYNMVKGENLDLDEKLDNDEHLEFNNRFDMRNMIPNFQNRMNYDRNHLMDRNNYDMDNLGSMLSENDYDESMRNMFDPLEFNMYRNNFLRRNRKYGANMLNRFDRYNDNDELARFLYTRNMLGDNRFRRSTKLPSSNEVFRGKRHVNNEDIDRNLIKKNPTKKEFETDDLKIQVDKKFKNEKTSLHKLAEEYTKLDKDKNSQIPSSSHSFEDNTELDESVTNKISEIPSDSSNSNQLTDENQINDFDQSHFNKPIFENMNQIITDSENALSKGVDIINDIKINELLENSNDSLKNIMSEPVPDDKEESDYSEIDYPEDWTNKAERVSPPIQKSKSDKRKNNTSDHHHSSTLGRLIGKIKHIIKFISEFGISDYIKGKRKNTQNSA